MVINKIFWTAKVQIFGSNCYCGLDWDLEFGLRLVSNNNVAPFPGLCVSRALHTPVNLADPGLMVTTKTSNSFSLLGTLFLWVF